MSLCEWKNNVNQTEEKKITNTSNTSLEYEWMNDENWVYACSSIQIQ